MNPSQEDQDTEREMLVLRSTDGPVWSPERIPCDFLSLESHVLLNILNYYLVKIKIKLFDYEI